MLGPRGCVRVPGFACLAACVRACLAARACVHAGSWGEPGAGDWAWGERAALSSALPSRARSTPSPPPHTHPHCTPVPPGTPTHRTPTHTRAPMQVRRLHRPPGCLSLCPSALRRGACVRVCVCVRVHMAGGGGGSMAEARLPAPAPACAPALARSPLRAPCIANAQEESLFEGYCAGNSTQNTYGATNTRARERGRAAARSGPPRLPSRCLAPVPARAHARPRAGMPCPPQPPPTHPPTEYGFPGRVLDYSDNPAPGGGFYWWGARSQHWNNMDYQNNMLASGQVGGWVGGCLWVGGLVGWRACGCVAHGLPSPSPTRLQRSTTHAHNPQQPMRAPTDRLLPLPGGVPLGRPAGLQDAPRVHPHPGGAPLPSRVSTCPPCLPCLACFIFCFFVFWRVGPLGLLGVRGQRGGRGGRPPARPPPRPALPPRP